MSGYKSVLRGCMSVMSGCMSVMSVLSGGSRCGEVFTTDNTEWIRKNTKLRFELIYPKIY